MSFQRRSSHTPVHQPRANSQEEQDAELAMALQAQENHRAQHPRRYQAGVHGSPHNQRRVDGHPHIPWQGGRVAAGGGALNDTRHAPGHTQRQRAREEQLQLALEANPEAFVKVPMLYVRCTLNNVGLCAFVDTGAQMTVMTLACAQKCNLIELIDMRFSGVASGVGVAKIVGRVHLATLRFGRTAAADVSITVMDQRGGPELLIGLDLLRKYKAHIDLEHNQLVIGGNRISFVDKGDSK